MNSGIDGANGPLMAIDEFYAAATAADVLRSQKELTRQGYSAGGTPPVGYRRAPEIVGKRRDGSALTRIRWEPDPEVTPRVLQAFQMAAEGATYDDIVDATGICSNKSSLATILANPIYRGQRVFNRETRVEGHHGRRRRRNDSDQHVTSSVEAIIPDPLWASVQARLVANRENRLPPQRYAGGYALSDILRCQCGGKMAGIAAGRAATTAAQINPRADVRLCQRPIWRTPSWISSAVSCSRRRQ